MDVPHSLPVLSYHFVWSLVDVFGINFIKLWWSYHIAVEAHSCQNGASIQVSTTSGFKDLTIQTTKAIFLDSRVGDMDTTK